MLSLKFKNIKFQRQFNKLEKVKVLGKFLENYLYGHNNYKRMLYKLKLIKILRRMYFNKPGRAGLKTRCIFTNRSRIISKKYAVSRFVLRDFMQFGLLPGCKKAVW
jgi:ribosomal protein S14